MVKDAEKYKAEDDQQRERIQAKNALESYAFNLKQTVEDEKLKDKISEDDKKTIIDKCNETISWLDANQVSLSHNKLDIISCAIEYSLLLVWSIKQHNK